VLETMESLLIGLFRFIGWRRGLAFAPPVTPEVAGSSPVAPAHRTTWKRVVLRFPAGRRDIDFASAVQAVPSGAKVQA
jgi:hypothetical protein